MFIALIRATVHFVGRFQQNWTLINYVVIWMRHLILKTVYISIFCNHHKQIISNVRSMKAVAALNCVAVVIYDITHVWQINISAISIASQQKRMPQRNGWKNTRRRDGQMLIALVPIRIYFIAAVNRHVCPDVSNRLPVPNVWFLMPFIYAVACHKKWIDHVMIEFLCDDPRETIFKKIYIFSTV